jgi:hypothetical protein
VRRYSSAIASPNGFAPQGGVLIDIAGDGVACGLLIISGAGNPECLRNIHGTVAAAWPLRGL